MVIWLQCWNKGAVFTLDGKRIALTKKTQMSLPNMKVMLVVILDWKGLIHYEFIPCGQTVYKEYYTEVLRHLKETVHKRSDLWKNRLLCYNIIMHSSRIIPCCQLPGEKQYNCSAPPTLFSRLSTSRLFLASKTWKDIVLKQYRSRKVG